MPGNRFGRAGPGPQGPQDENPSAGGGDPGIGLALRLERELDALSADVARSLRDEIGPQLTGLRTLAASLESRLAGSEPTLSPLAAVVLSQADSLIESVRALVARVRPDALSCGGLPEALRALAADWRLRRPGCRVEVLLDPPDDTGFGLASPAIETAALQAAAAVFERALGAGAATGIVLAASRSDARLVLQIEHDGAGPGVAKGSAAAPAWFASAQARIAALGGESQVERGELGGTSIVVRLPWQAAAGALPGGAGSPV